MVQLASHNVPENFFLCNSFTAPMTLESDFCDTFVESIRPDDEVVELKNRTTTLIVRDGLRMPHRSRQKNMKIHYGRVTVNEMPSLSIRASATIDILAQSQA